MYAGQARFKGFTSTRPISRTPLLKVVIDQFNGTNPPQIVTVVPTTSVNK